MSHHADNARLVRALALTLLTLVSVSAAAALVAPGAFATHAPTLALIAIVAVGLPHGALDISAVRAASNLGRRATMSVLALYIGLAVLTGALWLAAPAVALAAFIALATYHFAHDFPADAPAPLSLAVPLALFSAGAMRDGTAYDAIFVAIAGADAVIVTDALRAFAPVAHGGAIVALWLMFAAGARWSALAAAVSIGAMWTFPPVVGFALYFAAYHSPLHLADVTEAIRADRRRAVEAAVTFAAAVVLVFAIAALHGGSAAFSAFGSGVFIALSMLTVPHLLVPRLVSSWCRQQERTVRSTPRAAGGL